MDITKSKHEIKGSRHLLNSAKFIVSGVFHLLYVVIIVVQENVTVDN